MKLQEMTAKATAARAELHAMPEYSGREVRTIAYIQRFIKANTPFEAVPYGGGLYVEIPGTDPASPVIALRADFDAVALPGGGEKHICGHDGHTAALLGVAMALAEKQPENNVLLVFQSAEETGAGAARLVPLLKEKHVSEIYGSHNLPGFPFGQVLTAERTFACASCGLVLRFTGKPAHAAYPEAGISPAAAVAELLEAAIRVRNDSRYEAGTLCTVIGCRMGQKAFGTSAESAEVWLTIRSRTNDGFRLLQKALTDTATAAAARDGLTFDMEEVDWFPATENHASCAQKLIDRCGAAYLQEPMRWSEDFGHYLMNIPGAFFGVGAGEDYPELHTEAYEYPDALLEKQIGAFLNILFKETNA